MHPDASGALKELLFRVARRSAGQCESCRRVTTIHFYSPVDGIASDELALMLCALCTEVLASEMRALETIALMKQRIASILARAQS